MSSLTIQSTWDIAKGRNVLRKMILGQKYPPVVCARAVAAFSVLGELILTSRTTTSTLEISVVPRYGKSGVEITCKMPQEGSRLISFEAVQSQLMRAADSVEIREDDHQVVLTAYLWRDENTK